MRNPELWKPTKFVWRGDRLIGSRDRNEVSPGSRLITDLVASKYQRALSQYATGRLLDLGCGKAPLYVAYRDYVASTICVDWAESLHVNPCLDLVADLSKPLIIEDCSFETVLLSDVLEHIPAPERLCGEVSRVLTRKGYLILNVPFYYWIHEEPYDFYRYTEFALRRFMSLVGLEVIELTTVGGVPEILADVTSKLATRLRGGWMLASAIQQALVTLRRSKRFVSCSQESSASFPLGYFLVAQKV